MTSGRLAVLVASVALVLASPAAAQEVGQKGIVVAAPTSAGLVWQVTDKLAVRPLISFAWMSNGLDDIDLGNVVTPGGIVELPSLSLAADRSNYLVRLDFSVLWTVAKSEGLRVYLAPSIAHRWASSLLDNDALEVGGAFGMHYNVTKRFGVFGETGVRVDRSTQEFDFTNYLIEGSLKRSTTSVGSQSKVGVTFFF